MDLIDSNLRPAVPVGVIGRGNSMMDLRKLRVECVENSGPPSEVRVSGIYRK